MVMDQPYRILSLDGGGSLGVFTLGVLIEVERSLDRPLHEEFDLVFGTSTGSIIGSLLALGMSADEIHQLYMERIPEIMNGWIARSRSQRLERHAQEVFGEKKFDAFDLGLGVGIVATHLEYNRPMVFKNTSGRAHGSHGSFVPGFGCTIAEAVVSSCSAYPFFKKKRLSLENHGDRTTVDGGFVANNPTLFALADALGPLKIKRENLRVLSIGTGDYPVRMRISGRVLAFSRVAKTIMTLLRTSSNTVEQMRTLLFDKDIRTVRMDCTASDEAYRTNMLETRPAVLKSIFQLGRRAFEKSEQDIARLF